MHQLNWIIPDWPAPDNINCISTLRRGGVSRGRYSSFNLSTRVGDRIRHVKRNRKLLRSTLQLPDEPIWLRQQHGNRVIKLTASSKNNVQTDAVYATEYGMVCAVLTADCLPVLFCDRYGECIAAAHAGWRGLLNGVLENTLNTLPVEAERLLCWLGPAIGPGKFEVSEELRKKFMRRDRMHEQAFNATQVGKCLADIYQLAKNILMANGVGAVFGGGHCTYTEEQQFFSYRRDGTTGRMATMIWLNA